MAYSKLETVMQATIKLNQDEFLTLVGALQMLESIQNNETLPEEYTLDVAALTRLEKLIEEIE